MFVDFFIKRPILAGVIAILMTIGGAITIPTLPVARYPTLAAPQVIVSCVYIGASSEVVESAVTTPLEQAINGVEGMRYIQSSSTSNGNASVVITFEPWRSIDLAAIDVQNRVQQALPRLPTEVRATGVTVTPVLRTSSGRRGSVDCTRFSTSTAARSTSRDGSNVTVIVAMPSFVLLLWM